MYLVKMNKAWVLPMIDRSNSENRLRSFHPCFSYLTSRPITMPRKLWVCLTEHRLQGNLGSQSPSLPLRPIDSLGCYSTVVNMRRGVWGCVNAPFLWAEMGSLLWVIWKLAHRFGIIWFIILSSGLHRSGHESKPSEPHNGCCFTLLVSGVSQHSSVCCVTPDCFAVIGP